MGSERRAAEWHLAHRAGERSFVEQAKAVLEELPPGPGPILDLGCGSAPLAAWLDPQATGYVGLERDREMALAAARRRPHLRIVRAAAAHVPFPDGAFRAVVALGLFEYLPDPAGVLREAVRVTRAGGAVLVTVPRRDAPYRRGLAAAAPLLRLLGRPDPFDLRRGRPVTPAEAREWGDRAGAPLVGVRPVAPALVPWPLDRLFPDPPARRLPEGLGTAWLFRYACPAGGARGEW